MKSADPGYEALTDVQKAFYAGYDDGRDEGVKSEKMNSDRTGKRPDVEVPGTEILRVLVGSRAHGTANEDSDTDIRIVYVIPTVDLFDIRKTKVGKTVWLENKELGKDVTGWEAHHFCHLALQCNPTILEVLWAPVIESTVEGEALRDLRENLLSRQRIRDSFLGYARNQRKKMLNDPSIGWTPNNWKFAEAYLRVLYQGISLLQMQYLPVELKDHKMLDTLLEIREGKAGIGWVTDRARQMEEQLESAYLSSSIRDEADITEVNKWLRQARKDHWE